jgi:hypothetical protein
MHQLMTPSTREWSENPATCTPCPVSALRYAGSVAVSVFPSPVAISQMHPETYRYKLTHLKKQSLKPVFHLLGSRVETTRFSSYATTGFNLACTVMNKV